MDNPMSDPRFEVLRRQGEMVCKTCGAYSSAVYCYPCTQILSGNHPATEKMAAEIDRLIRLVRKWHPYPQEKPPKPGRYLISWTHDEGTENFFFWEWLDDDPWFFAPDPGLLIAWQELPEHYKEKDNV